MVISGGDFLKEWECVQVGDHKNVGKVIKEWQEKGWHVHTYACAGIGAMMAVNHYLLFEKGE
jgi:hypothetical protein